MSDVPGVTVVKRVPKWAWIASAGVVGGVLYMRRKGNADSGSQVDMSNPNDITAPADYGSTFPASGVVSGPAYSSGQMLDSGTDLAGLVGAIGGIYSDANAQHAANYDASQERSYGLISQLIDALPGTAGGGGAPAANPATNGAASAPAAPTAPPLIVPVGIGQTPQPATGPKAPACPPDFPRKEANGGCYRFAGKTIKQGGKTKCQHGRLFRDGTFKVDRVTNGKC